MPYSVSPVIYTGLGGVLTGGIGSESGMASGMKPDTQRLCSVGLDGYCLVAVPTLYLIS